MDSAIKMWRDKIVFPKCMSEITEVFPDIKLTSVKQ